MHPISTQPMEPELSKEEKQNQTKQYLKYSGLGFQMIAVLLLALWGGQVLDEKMEMNFFGNSSKSQQQWHTLKN